MLCPECRRLLARDADACPRCGAPRATASRPGYELVLPDGTRTPIEGDVTIGRDAGNRVRLADPAVSRRHARVAQVGAAVAVHDLGSRYGTFVEDRLVRSEALARDGQRIRVGDSSLRVERERRPHEEGRTVIVPVGATAPAPAQPGTASADALDALPLRPRLRSGWALKRLPGGEGAQRYVLASLRGEGRLRFTEAEAELVSQLDGHLTVSELVALAGRDAGQAGVQRLLVLLAELGDAGFLAGSEAPGGEATGRLRRLVGPRERVAPSLPAAVERLYALAGHRLFTRSGLAAMLAVVVAGPLALAHVVALGGARPFHVAGAPLLGAAAFIAGRFALVALHELAHALTLAALGRRARRIGIKVVLVFPYAFVDTSDAWFETRRRRLAVSAAGPFADGVLAGGASFAAALLNGPLRDVAFQLALGGYAGALLNLNPMLERDGYHMLADALDEPRLRPRALEEVYRVVTGRPRPAGGAAPSRALRAYAVVTVAWSLLAAALVAAVTLRAARSVVGSEAALAATALASAAASAPMLLLLARAARTRRQPRTTRT